MRRTLAVTVITVGAFAGLSAPALAATDPAYPPTTPSPTATQVLPSSAVLGTKVTVADPQVAVLGIKLDALPRTGSEIATVSGLGALLVAGGIGAVRLSRRPRGSHN